MNQPELPIDQRLDTNMLVDREEMAYEIGCVAFHRQQEGDDAKNTSR